MCRLKEADTAELKCIKVMLSQSNHIRVSWNRQLTFLTSHRVTPCIWFEFGQVGMYCNVTSKWRFPETRWKCSINSRPSIWDTLGNNSMQDAVKGEIKCKSTHIPVVRGLWVLPGGKWMRKFYRSLHFNTTILYNNTIIYTTNSKSSSNINRLMHRNSLKVSFWYAPFSGY